ncbi:hypothetical protein Dsin_017594 [Dipteronia sinensis]|uniref:Uncharacterized protein n=1 Tax=Dipteronia sinensis TaxID=43782 RepID=A0AAE0E817_9ROSI|nr:hypothetical protein Dsin_017594 [Dipteronia sinensis]
MDNQDSTFLQTHTLSPIFIIYLRTHLIVCYIAFTIGLDVYWSLPVYLDMVPGPQGIMQVLLLIHRWRLRRFSMLPCSFRWNSNISTFFDEPLHGVLMIGAVQPWILLLLISIGLQQYRRKQQCHGVFAWLVWALDITEVLESLLNMSIYAGALGFLSASAII